MRFTASGISKIISSRVKPTSSAKTHTPQSISPSWRTWFAAAAVIILGLAVGGWALFHGRNENLMAQMAVLDLRDRSIARGTEANPAEPPLEIARSVSHLMIYLPRGSSEGDYDVRVLGPEEQILFGTKGPAISRQGIMSLAVGANLTSVSPGLYILQVRKFDSGWASYSLRLK